MNDILLIVLSITACLAIYWIVIGQWKYNKMMRQHHKPANLKAIIFDLDGVIIDSLDAWLKVFNNTRQHYKLPEITKKEFVDTIWGGTIERDIKIYFKGKTAEEISRHYFSNMGKFKTSTKLSRNVKETLKKIKEKNIKLGVVTNTYRKPTLQILGYHKIKSFFDAVVGGDEIKNGKPAPDSLLEACKRLKIKPEEAVLIGDTVNDKGAANNARMFFIGYKTNGDLRIDDLKDLLHLV
jgi:HAD superfamily hydrolase (TIGR01549 family)